MLDELFQEVFDLMARVTDAPVTSVPLINISDGTENLYVVECNCTNKFNDRILETECKPYTLVDLGITDEMCTICNKYPWVILNKNHPFIKELEETEEKVAQAMIDAGIISNEDMKDDNIIITRL